MRRRDFITALGGTLAAWPLGARAQQVAMPLIGYLSSYSQDGIGRRTVEAFLQGLADAGFSDGRNVTIAYRWADGRYEQLAEMAAELVRLNVSVIAVSGSQAAITAKAATTTIPIVFSIGIDPVESGFVASIARPGGNLTGAARLNVELMAKRLEFLREIVPAAENIAAMTNPANTSLSVPVRSATEFASASLRQELSLLRASNDSQLDEAFETAAKQQIKALIISPDAYFSTRAARIAALSLKHRIATIANHRDFVAAGCLLAYGSDNTVTERISGLYAGRILKGAKPSELPVQQPTKFELIINGKTAKALGLIIPPTLLAFATEVIE